jgi:glycosyltransferase A (GT-A) superfamily protein (DUF2064 family)
MPRTNQIGIIIFSKVPKQDFVKTRIKHNQLPKNFQYQLQIAMMLDTFTSLAQIKDDFIPILSFYPKEEQKLLQETIIEPLKKHQPQLSARMVLIPQKGKSLAERFQNAFFQVFTDMNLSSALIIGIDTPHIQPRLISKAIQILQLKSSSSVLGPSQEGGFYVLGYNTPFLSNLDTIFAKNKSQQESEIAYEILSKSTEVNILPFTPDIDRFEDLITFIHLIKGIRSQKEDTNDVHIPTNTINLLKTLNDHIWE